MEVKPQINIDDKTSRTEDDGANQDGQMTIHPNSPTYKACQGQPAKLAAVSVRQQVHNWMAELTDIA